MPNNQKRPGRSSNQWVTSFRNNVLAGVAVLLPLWLTFVVLKFLLDRLNDLFLNPIVNVFRPYLPWMEVVSLTFVVKILIFFVLIAMLAFLGLAARSLLVKRIISFFEALLAKVPIVSNIYSAIQQLSQTFIARQKNVFQRAVLTEYPRKGVYALGLVTSEAHGEVQEKTARPMINVFVPTTPNPTSGFLLMVPASEIISLDMNVEDALKMIISGGAITPEFVKQTREKSA